MYKSKNNFQNSMSFLNDIMTVIVRVIIAGCGVNNVINSEYSSRKRQVGQGRGVSGHRDRCATIDGILSAVRPRRGVFASHARAGTQIV